MEKPIVSIGDRFGRLVVVVLDLRLGKHRAVECECICGRSIITRIESLRKGATRSCGCLADEERKKNLIRTTRHGHTSKRQHSRTYSSWHAMLTRCENRAHHTYCRYGGAGVSVCDRWHDFQNFLDDMGERPPGTSIDRIDPHGNYVPENCRWATPKVQANNKRVRISRCEVQELKGVAIQKTNKSAILGLPTFGVVHYQGLGKKDIRTAHVGVEATVRKACSVAAMMKYTRINVFGVNVSPEVETVRHAMEAWIERQS